MSAQTELPRPETKMTIDEAETLMSEIDVLLSQLNAKREQLRAADLYFSKLDFALYAIREEDLRLVNPGEACTTPQEMPFALSGWRRAIKERIRRRQLNPSPKSCLVIRGLQMLSTAGGLNNLLREKPAIRK